MMTILISEHHVLWPRTVQFIRDVYSQEYGARPAHFPSKLIVMLDERGDIACAAGLRSCYDGFFSECYLDASIESVLTQITGKHIMRETVFEVTTTASRAPNLIIRFITDIINYGVAAGFDWVFFTLTSRLQLLLDRIGVELIPVASADILRVSNPKSWGNYYAMDPRVYAGGQDSLTKRFESRHLAVVTPDSAIPHRSAATHAA